MFFFHEVGNNDLILANLKIEGLKGSRSQPYLICLLENNCETTKSSRRGTFWLGSFVGFLLSFWYSTTPLFYSFVFLPNSFGCCCLLPVSILLLWPLLFPAFLAGLFLLPSWLTDELYAQKLKYKAISEELDHALNDMTSLWPALVRGHRGLPLTRAFFAYNSCHSCATYTSNPSTSVGTVLNKTWYLYLSPFRVYFCINHLKYTCDDTGNTFSSSCGFGQDTVRMGQDLALENTWILVFPGMRVSAKSFNCTHCLLVLHQPG